MNNNKIVSIVGRPNVGKSTIFNRLTKSKRKSMTFDVPGVTRDGHYGVVSLDEFSYEKTEPQTFLLVDTGGFYVDSSKVVDAGISEEEILWEQVAAQSMAAIKESDFCLVVVDVRDGLMPADTEIIKMLRESNKLFWLLINKCDSRKQDIDTFEFAKFGLDEDEIFMVSAEHDIGFDVLREQLQLVVKEIEGKNVALLSASVVPAFPMVGSLAIIGAPNVGKSTLLNQLLGFERSIVSPVAGTTVDPVEAYLTIEVAENADAVDNFWQKQDLGYLGGFVTKDSKPFELDHQEKRRSILILDTAGIRRQASVDGFIETQSVYRSLRCLTDASLVIYVVDAFKGLTHQDRHLIGLSLEKGKTIFLVLNKYDLVKKQLQKDETDVKDWLEHWQEMVPWLQFCEMIPISAKTGEGVLKVKKMIQEFFIKRAEQVSTGELNRVAQALISNKPLNFPMGKGVTLKLKYASLVKNFPPTILLFTNKSQNIPIHYRRYLINGIREGMDWKNTPVHLIFRTNADRERRDAEFYQE